MSEKDGARRFRKKPVVIEAIHFDGNRGAVKDFTGQACVEALRMDGTRGPRIVIETLEGTTYADPGDWIIRGVKSEFYPCKPDIFAATYDPVEEPTPPAPQDEAGRCKTCNGSMLVWSGNPQDGLDACPDCGPGSAPPPPDDAELPARVLAMCKARKWSLHWTARGAYLHLEASELIEALRGKRGDPTLEAADVLIVLMSITENAGIPWNDVLVAASAKVDEMQTRPRYAGEEFGPLEAEALERERAHIAMTNPEYEHE